jgi:hypothetical protein
MAKKLKIGETTEVAHPSGRGDALSAKEFPRESNSAKEFPRDSVSAKEFPVILRDLGRQNDGSFECVFPL